MHLHKQQIEVVDDKMAQVLRLKTGAERLQIASDMFSSARQMIISTLRNEHPDWDEKKVNAETARRLSHGAL